MSIEGVVHCVCIDQNLRLWCSDLSIRSFMPNFGRAIAKNCAS